MLMNPPFCASQCLLPGGLLYECWPSQTLLS